MVWSLSERVVGVVRPASGSNALQDRVAELYLESREDVYRYLLTLGLHPPQAQETAQEVFLRLYASLKKGEEILSPRGWIFRVAHNLGLRIRARQDADIPYDPDLEARFPARGEDPEGRLLRRESALRFHRAVEGLSEQQRRCLFLRMEGLRYLEIGTALGISASAVGEFLRRAVARLRQAHE